MKRPLRKKKKVTLLVLKSNVSVENTRTVYRVQNQARQIVYGFGLKLRPNNHPDPLSPSEEIQQKSVDKTGVTENESCRA